MWVEMLVGEKDGMMVDKRVWMKAGVWDGSMVGEMVAMMAAKWVGKLVDASAAKRVVEMGELWAAR